MPPPFNHISRDEVIDLISRFPFRRTINAVHLHHTWRPNHAQYRGEDTILAMYHVHTNTNGWNDIAQHLTVAPDGSVWLGRDWDQPPASASGNNGSVGFGPFMIEMIGDFDKGRDRLEGEQLATVLEIVARLQLRCNLPLESLRFHHQMSSKSCPGSSVDYDAMLELLAKRRAAIKSELAAPSVAAAGPFGDSALRIQDLVDAVRSGAARGLDPADAEPAEEEGADLTMLSSHIEYESRQGGSGENNRGITPLSALDRAALRPYVINLTQGVFSSTGDYQTDPSDVDAIFGEYLPAYINESHALGRTPRLMIYAHGGLVSESNALQIARQQIPWWVHNGVYPIHFVWETGLFETIGGLLKKTGERLGFGGRDLWDYTVDPIVERVARALFGPTIWGGMKQSAERSVAEGGGALYTALALKKFCAAHTDLELHAVGHSAGAIFQANFVPTALDKGVPAFHSMQFMAPAIRVDEFITRLAGRLGNGVDYLTLYTMKKDLERDDNCIGVYHKSLLYLIYHALEPDPETPILGLEESLRSDYRLRNLFGLAGATSTLGEVLWSKTAATSGRSATRATSHGGFDDDCATMNSILRRILSLGNTGVIEPFPGCNSADRGIGERLRSWNGQFDWPEGLRLVSSSSVAENSANKKQPASPSHGSLSNTATTSPVTTSTATTSPAITSSGRRRALCVGIDNYGGGYSLSGCVADARLWGETLAGLGFETPRLLLDQEATRKNILEGFTELVGSSRAGDVLVFQYAGHGTQLPDLNGDEADGDTPGLDEAFCPIDFPDGKFLIDDDIGTVIDTLPAGVNLTLFIDCCHSGTISRMLFGGAASLRPANGGARPRYINATSAMAAAHEKFRSTNPQGVRDITGRGIQREILFSACRSSEVAWEQEGHGDFTLRATRLLRVGIDGVSNSELHRRLLQSFGDNARQHPELWCAEGIKSFAALQRIS